MKIAKITIDGASHFFHAPVFLIVSLLAVLPVNSGATPFATPSATDPGAMPGIQMAICNSAVITGNVRHISLSGHDATADGSAARPYRTLYRAVQDAVSQDTLLVHGGTYQEPNEIRIRVPGVTIRSQPGEWAIIDRTTRGEWDSGIYFYVGSDYGVLTCIEVIGGFYVVSTETKWDWGDPNDRSGASHLRIENTRLHGSYADVIKIKPNSDDILIRYNEIFISGVGQPGNDCNAEGIDNVNGDRTLVAYNHIHDICSTGVYLKGGATDGVVEHNLIERTGAAGILLGFDTSPEYFDTSANPQYYENIRGIARYNLIRNPGWAGIGFYASKDAQAYRNTILNAAAVYHSPIYFGISYQDWEPTAGRPPNQNPSISQNVIVSQSVPRDPALVEIRYANDLGGLSALTDHPRMSDNCYYRLAGPAAFHDQRTDWSGNLVAWQAHIQGDAGAYEGDPQLDDNAQPRNPACAGRGYTFNTLNPAAVPNLVFSGDYNGNGRADLIWRHETTGQVYGVLLEGYSITQQGMVYTESNTAWRIIHNGDFNGDGRDELLWWNNQTGQVYQMPMNGLNIAGGAKIYQEPNTTWQIVAVGDLNGDNKDDLIWWNNSSGQVYGMLMNGSGITQGGMIYQEANTAWRILAARDFNADGNADLLWRNTTTGQVYLMPMNGLNIAGGALVYHESNLAWSITAVGDLNGDRKADLIWWNNSTGQVYGMLMNGPGIAKGGMLYQEPNTAWQIIASGDYTGDGKTDLLWRNATTGQVYEMVMNGLSVVGGAQIYQEANPNWRILATAAEVPHLPLPGAASAPLTGNSINAYRSFEDQLVNPSPSLSGAPLNSSVLPATE